MHVCQHMKRSLMHTRTRGTFTFRIARIYGIQMDLSFAINNDIQPPPPTQ